MPERTEMLAAHMSGPATPIAGTLPAMPRQTKDQQVKRTCEGLALGVLSLGGVQAVTSGKMELEFGFNHAWRRWPHARRFPSLGGHDPGNLFWGGIHKSEGRVMTYAAWRTDRWAWPYVTMEQFTADDCLDMLREHGGLPPDAWRTLARDFVDYFKPEHLVRTGS